MLPYEAKEELREAYLRCKDFTPKKKESELNKAIESVKSRYSYCFRNNTETEKVSGHSEALVKKARELAKDGYTIAEVEKILGCSRTVIRKGFREQ